MTEFEKWLALSEVEREVQQRKWNAYAGEAESLVAAVAAHLQEKYASSGVVVSGPGIQHGGTWVIVVNWPPGFDRSSLASTYLGIDLR